MRLNSILRKARHWVVRTIWMTDCVLIKRQLGPNLCASMILFTCWEKMTSCGLLWISRWHLADSSELHLTRISFSMSHQSSSLRCNLLSSTFSHSLIQICTPPDSVSSSISPLTSLLDSSRPSSLNTLKEQKKSGEGVQRGKMNFSTYQLVRTVAHMLVLIFATTSCLHHL